MGDTLDGGELRIGEIAEIALKCNILLLLHYVIPGTPVNTPRAYKWGKQFFKQKFGHGLFSGGCEMPRYLQLYLLLPLLQLPIVFWGCILVSVCLHGLGI